MRVVHQSLNFKGLLIILIILIEVFVIPASLDDHEWASILFPIILMLHLIIIALLFMKRPKFYQATFVFIIYFLIYQIINPLLYASGVSWVVGGEFLLGNWDLISRGFCYSLLGLTSYYLGAQIVRKRKKQGKVESYSVGWLTDDRIVPFITIMFLIAIISWVILFARMDFPLEALGARPAMARERDDTSAFGFGYFFEIIFAANIGLLAYIVRRPRKYIMNKYFILMVAVIFFLNGLGGTRLILIGLILSIVMMLKIVEAKSCAVKPISWSSKIANIAKAVAGATILMIGSIFYVDFRTGGIDNIDYSMETIIFFITNTFDTAVTYFMVLERVPREVDYWGGCSLLTPILFRIPTIFIPTKYEIICNTAKFTYQFYGYDQNLPNTISRGQDLFAELYLNFGVTAIVITMFILGYVNENFTQIVQFTSSRVLLIIYTIYISYLIPYSFKAGLIDALSYADVKLTLIPIGIALVVIKERMYKKKDKNILARSYEY